MQKIHKILIVGIIVLAMVNIASASVRPNYVVEVYGIEPAVWLAFAAGIGAVLQHVGRYYQKKHSTPDFVYDRAYLYTTALAILGGCQLVAAIPVTELTIPAIMFYLASGVTGTEGVNKITKVTTTKYIPQPGDTE